MFKNDGILTDILATYGSAYTNKTGYLSQGEVDDLYSTNRFLQKIISILPEDALAKEPMWNLEEGDVDRLINDYRAIDAIGEPLEDLDIQSAIVNACIYGRLYGDGFLFLGVNDGLDPAEPLDMSRVNSLDWIAVKHRYQVGMDYKRDGYMVYVNHLNQMPTNNVFFHRSRVIRVPGIKLYASQLSYNAGYNSSILQSVYREYQAYLDVINASKDMLQSHSIFKYKLKNLATMVVTGDSDSRKSLKSRFESIIQGLSSIGGLMFDAEAEDAEFITRNYGGVDNIITKIQDWFIGAADIPRGKLFGSAASNALSEASEGERWEWNNYVARYQANRVHHVHHKLGTILLAAQGKEDNNFSVSYPPHYQMSEKEEVQLRKVVADTDKIYFDMGLPAEVIIENRFDGGVYSRELVLSAGTIAQMQKEAMREQMNTGGSDEEE